MSTSPAPSGSPKQAAGGVFDAIIIGAGAAGMMCAAVAAARGRRVLLIDHARKLAEKIRISGGGRCNFTNRRVSADNYLSRNPHFVRSALARYGSADFIELVERYGIAYHEREHGQLFCDDSARDIIALLRAECDDAGVKWALATDIEAVERLAPTATATAADGAAGDFLVHSSAGSFRAPALVIASGGLSIPKIGATPFGYRIAEQFGLAIVPPQPALVPLTLAPEQLARLAPLAGISFDVEASCRGPAFRAAALITHRGLSGPAILQVSSYWQAQASSGKARAPISLNLLPGIDTKAWMAAKSSSRALPASLLAEHLPRRFAQAWCELEGWNRPLRELSAARREEFARSLTNWELHPNGTQGYAKAEVTLGGVDTRGLSSRTMAARNCPGLYFIGEVVDVTGQLGGYNFQWAWSSAQACGEAL